MKRPTVHGHPCADNQGRVLESRLIAETALGKPLPPDSIVHHIDGNNKNNSSTNLILCQDRGYHGLLHRRAEALRQSGSVHNYRCSRCNKWLPESGFYPSTFKIKTCKECHKDIVRKWRAKSRDKIREYNREYRDRTKRG